MRNKKAKLIRKFAKRIAKSEETTYNIGKPPVINTSDKPYLTNSGFTVMPGRVIIPGIPTTLDTGCLKYVAKRLKNG